MKNKNFFYIVIAVVLFGCTKDKEENKVEPKSEYYLGADLSYVNEVEDNGGIYRVNGEEVDPFELFSERGADIVRVRLWHSPQWTNYSNYEDVKKTIQRAKDNNMEILLDFHYSDTWADVEKQIIPEAWKDIVGLNILGDSVYQYTFKTLIKLSEEDLAPKYVQIGNEINIEILQQENNMVVDKINWSRNSYLINRGLQAVKDASEAINKNIETMLHIAQPEDALWWFGQATRNGINKFDLIGISYYPKWSEYPLNQISYAIKSLKNNFNKDVMIVETGYPHTLEDIDDAANVLWEDALINGYPATPEKQLQYMIDLTRLSIQGGAIGVIYWEPAWITSNSQTQWGKGSHWDNATFFDAKNGNEALPAFDYYNKENY